ncbi:MAG: NADH-quinone oxidoreductase subunit N [Gemmatimonadales bacterium]|nr:NADH-quinone oxidoreductase subunit N [Gemmatimonadales bacterium]
MPLDLDTGRGLAVGLLPEIILSGWAMLLLLVAAWRHREPGAQRQLGWLSVAGLTLTSVVVAWLWAKGVHAEGLTTSMAVDAFRWAVDLIVLLGAALTILLSIGYLDREGIQVPEYHILVLFATVGMMLLAGGADLFVIFLGLELMSVSVYVLAGINRRSAVGAEAALKYFLLGAFASAFFLYGIALVYGATGTTKLAVMGMQVSSLGVAKHPMLVAGLGLLFIGFAFKVAAVPFHMWAPDVYDGAPSPVTAFMAAAVKAAAFGAFVRLLLMGFSSMHPSWDVVIWWLAAVTMAVGNLVALAQRNLKRMLAYSSVAHAGYLLTALVSGSLAGAAAFLFYLLFYTLMTVGAFAVLIAKGRGGERDVTTDDLAGLAESDPWLAFVMAVCMLSLLGFPGTAGFIGKWYILTSATGSGYAVLAAVLVLTSVVSAGYYLPVIMAMYMKPRLHEQAHAEVKLPGLVRGMLVAVVAALLLFGVWPNEVLKAARDGSHAFLPASAAVVASPMATH